MRIGDFDTAERVLVVAEIGNNHEGDVALAERLVDLAAEAGAGAVKFQTFSAKDLISRREAARFDQLRRFELSPAAFERLARAAERAGVLFLSTPFDLGSVEVLEPLVAAYKIASGDNTFYPLIEAVAATGKPVLLSTGMASLDQIERARLVIEAAWNPCGHLALLHCVSGYPVPPEQANLAAIGLLRDAFECTVGYSDHTIGIEAAGAAVAIGARIVEKHFTIAKDHSDFRDHALSADAPELRALVQRVHLVERMLGTGGKTVQSVERPTAAAARRSIVARRDLEAGEVIQIADLTWVRPAGGLAPGEEHLVVGRTLCRALAAGEPIIPEMLAETD